MASSIAEPISESPIPTHAASECHSESGAIIRDMTIGFADGMTVPFALTAGLSSLGSSKIVIIGGLAELFSGAISMGLGAYLAAVTDRDHYKSEEAREREEVLTKPSAEKEECFEILDGYGISREASRSVIDCLTQDTEQWIRFMMDFELKLEKPNVSRAWISAATMGISYFIGGLLPMIPYFAIKNTNHALFISIGITVVVCIIFGFSKNYAILKTKRAGFYGAAQTLLVGALAAGTSYGIVYGVDHSSIAA
ncbi:Vacuolar iron transporter 1 [Penicillium daleae]|uniref:Vacuolar iron transporter 1 n=1 Tax=Penicillium daleae TaxID=63821 RepID=A0AAD6BWG3_9EURO|nr:Vacuolar iron transporter 1 [Penicillium daleae]KAJ5432612.1 Vacuolar iron transporter 1 [Penicillium daleae]